MDIEDRLHIEQRRSQMTMTKTLRIDDGVRCDRLIWAAALFLTVFVAPATWGQTVPTLPPTGPQQLAFAGLRGTAGQGQVNAVQVDAAGEIYLLLDQKDGVRLIKTDASSTNVLAQALLGAKGDIGLGMSLDPAGNVYITGTTTSSALAGTSGSAFTTVADTSTNSFVAKFDANLNTLWVTLCGSGRLATVSVASTADAVFVTGSIFAATLPVTPAGIIQAPAFGSAQNGFVERFSADGKTLVYATYLSGANGITSPAGIAADSSDATYIAGYTTSPGYPTVSALVPALLGTTSGFVTKLTPKGDGITFSTYVPGAGIASLVLDAAAGNLLLAGGVALGQFPVTGVATPLANTPYQVLVRMALDGSAVTQSTVLAPGSQAFVTTAGTGVAWVDGALGLPLLPLASLQSFGTSFAVRVNAAGAVDQTARFGGLASANVAYASAPVTLTGVAADASGQPVVGGGFAPQVSASLAAAQTYDLPLANAPTTARPTTVRGAASTTCAGSVCSGGAGYLAKLSTPSASAVGAALAVSVDDAPNVTVRNLGSVAATGLKVTATGFTTSTNCGTTLPAGAECSVALGSTGAGTIAISASNATTQTMALPAVTTGATLVPVVFTPRELDFGIVSAASGPVTRTITVTNLGTSNQTFTSAWDTSAHTTLPYTFAETLSDCTTSGASTVKLLAPGGVCHITIGLTASTSATNDGPIATNWSIGTRDVALTAFGQAAALSVSAAEVDFGTQFVGGLRTARYLYLSNSSTGAVSHAAVTLPGTSPFSVTDRCPGLLEPGTVCQMQFAYQNAKPNAADAVTLALDGGINVLVTGKTLPQPSANGASANPNLSVSATALNFATAVVVTGVSSSTQTVTIGNTGTAAFALALGLTGDFTDTTNCGATLPGGASCSVVVTFAPSQPGTRQGLLTLTAGAGTTPTYVTLSGVGTGILTPANNGTLNFGAVIAGQPSVQWYKVTQSFSMLTATVSGTASGLGSPYGAVLVEDIGYGHGAPPASAFSVTATGTCFNCWLGVQFRPSTTGVATATLSLSSIATGNAYVLALTGTGLPLTGLVLTPVTQDFGPVPLNSSSTTALFQLTNLLTTQAAVAVSAPAVTGDFAVSNAASGGATCNGTLAYTASCFVQVMFAPTATGQRTGTLTLTGGGTTATAALMGYGASDPGLSLSPSALVFNNVPGSLSSSQTVTLSNTSGTTVVVGTPTAGSPSAFAASSTCGTLAAGSTCTISVSFTASTATASGTLQIPVTTMVGGAPVLTTYTVPLTGAYTTENAGIEIVPGALEYGPQATGTMGGSRIVTIDNLTTKSFALSVALPRQYVLAGPPCSGLAPMASCSFSTTFLPLTNGDITGTLFAQAVPTDGSSTVDGIGYVEGYGVGTGVLSVTGALLPGELLSFGQVASGQSATRVLTLANAGTGTALLTIRRITSGWPFLSTTTCGTTLSVGQTCTVTLMYTPLNQVATGTTSPAQGSDTGTLVIESDAMSSPDMVDLAGTSTAALVGTPSNNAPLVAFVTSQSSLTFASTMAGNVSAPQTVTLSNTGTATLHILGLQSSPDFAVTSNCGAIVPGASCTLIVTFTPQPGASTTRASAVEIASDASTSLEFVSLVGTATPSAIQLGQTALNFGTVIVGSSTTLPLSVTNTGSSSATFTGVSASGDFASANGSCPAAGLALAAGTSCTLQITFTPTLSGPRTGVLAVATTATTLPLSVVLTGTGAQSHLQVSPSSLAFGTIAVGASASLSLTLANLGTAAITGISVATGGDYAATVPCAVTTLAPGASCSVTVTFTPSAIGARPGTLTVTSSDPSSPVAVPLTGAGTANGTFSLTVNGAATGTATVTSGQPATYPLAVTPAGGFTGAVVLNCTPVTAAQYAFCSLLPSSVTLTSGAQNSVATITTVTSVATASLEPRNLRDTALCLMFPAMVLWWKGRRSSHKAWRKLGPMAWMMLCSMAMLSASGCGSGSVTTTSNPNLRYVAPGTYQYQVTASSVSGGQATQVTQTVLLTLIVQ